MGHGHPLGDADERQERLLLVRHDVERGARGGDDLLDEQGGVGGTADRLRAQERDVGGTQAAGGNRRSERALRSAPLVRRPPGSRAPGSPCRARGTPTRRRGPGDDDPPRPRRGDGPSSIRGRPTRRPPDAMSRGRQSTGRPGPRPGRRRRRHSPVEGTSALGSASRWIEVQRPWRAWTPSLRASRCRSSQACGWSRAWLRRPASRRRAWRRLAWRRRVWLMRPASRQRAWPWRRASRPRA